MSKIAVFLDSDGTSIYDVPYNNDPEGSKPSSKTGEIISRLYENGCEVVVVSSQPYILPGSLPVTVFQDMKNHARDRLREKANVGLPGFDYYPYFPGISNLGLPFDYSSQKTLPELILSAAFDLELDLRRSWLVGDTLDSIEAGRRTGCHTILIKNGREAEWMLSPERQPHFIVSNLDEAARTIISILKFKDEDLFRLDVDQFSVMVEQTQ